MENSSNISHLLPLLAIWECSVPSVTYFQFLASVCPLLLNGIPVHEFVAVKTKKTTKTLIESKTIKQP